VVRRRSGLHGLFGALSESDCESAGKVRRQSDRAGAPNDVV